ncbi:MAG: hypothetical protein K2M44_01410 [Clostridia bacterium]|nr:hypothetical protein [Clostridia bacterium]
MSIKWVKYMWALAFAMAIALACGAICSFINIKTDVFSSVKLPYGISGVIVSAGCAFAYVLLIAVMSRLIVGGAGRYAAAVAAICLFYIIWTVVFMGASSLVGGLSVALIIAVYSVGLGVILLMKDWICGLIFAPITLWHIYLAIMSLLTLRVNI